MQTFIERIELSQRFAGRGANDLDRLKQMRADGWNLTVLIEHERAPRGQLRSSDFVIALGYLSDDELER